MFAYHPDAAPVDRARLRRIRDRMAPRGPDGAGEWVGGDGRAALAHRRLAVIDLSARGAQPMADPTGRTVVAFNGEIYNHRALRVELERKGYRFRSESDTEVLLHLYAERGAEMVHHLRGMFAFALWDGARQGLLLARDPFGIKPLYYADDGRSLHAASEVRALLAGGGVDTRAEPAGHVGFFLWGHVPEPYTLYRGVRALPAGSTLWVGREGPGPVRRYADVSRLLAEAGREGAERGVEAREAADEIRAALLDSVRHHLVADVEVGVFLSAGLDSGTLAALAAEAGGRTRTLTLGFEPYRGTARDEVPLAETVAARYGTDHRTVWVGREDFRREIPRLLDRMDQPSMDGVNSYLVSRAAAGAGLKVALSGVGGDELFGGYPSFREIPALVSAVRRVPGAAALGRGFRLVAAPVLRRLTSPKYAGLLEYGGDHGGAYLLRRGLFMPWELPSVLDPDLVREGWRELDSRARLRDTVAGVGPERLRVSALEAGWYLRHQLLRDLDWASMSHSLEVRVPLVDWTLWGRVAPLLARRPELDKRALARAARPALPTEVLERPKTGFSVPARDWVVQEHGSRYAGRGLRGWTRFVHEAAA